MLDIFHGASGASVADACKGKLIYEGAKKVRGAVIDSRKVSEGDLFVAIVGERTDGHLYLTSAAEKGASAVLTERIPEDLTPFENNGCSVILCENTSLSLAYLASEHKKECELLTVGVTGSVGKTTTRQFIAAVLNAKFPTHKTEGNFNNALGLPLTLLGIKEEHKAAVIEMGMSAKGEISFLTKLTRPNIGVITVIGSSHIEHLGSREGIRDAKLEIRDGMTEDGVLVLNGDEPLLSDIENAVYVSLRNKECPYRAENIRNDGDGMVFDAITPDGVITDCRIPTLGEHTVLDAMYAVTVGKLAGLTDNEIKLGLSSFVGVGMRQNIVKHNGITFINDYYNASPESIKASLSVTKGLSKDTGGRTVAVIGNVMELGERSEELHRSVGKFVSEIGVDLLFTFGNDASYIADEALKNGFNSDNVFVFTDIKDEKPISKCVAENLQENDCVLIKASHGIDMGRIAKILLEN
ncbi:MAG: UDP-N-acetylmuramoyl-tripeptide--D-alanyl-D-alanine ligase [Ruminococcaceae bacterium]|nr:UDP-N-acetylmuramoyl-tripeptide--D-alanyl-D-alanine ligase [Oscillospiraceae bacterium]